MVWFKMETKPVLLPSLTLVIKENMIPQFPEILSDFFMDHSTMQTSLNPW